MQTDPYYDELAREWVIPLANGCVIRSGCLDRDDPNALPAGEYVKVLGPKGSERLYREWDEFLCTGHEPDAPRRRLWELIQVCRTNPEVPCVGD